MEIITCAATIRLIGGTLMIDIQLGSFCCGGVFVVAALAALARLEDWWEERSGSSDPVHDRFLIIFHRISFVAMISFILVLVISFVYSAQPIQTEVADKIQFVAIYVTLIAISAYLGRIPKMDWNHKTSTPTSKGIYWALFPGISMVVAVSAILILSGKVEGDNLGIITGMLFWFLAIEVFCDLLSFVDHLRRHVNGNDNLPYSIEEWHDEGNIAYGIFVTLVMLSGIVVVIYSTTLPSQYLAWTGLILSAEHLIAAFTD